MKSLTIRLPENLFELIVRKAQRNMRSKNNEIVFSLKQQYEEEVDENGFTLADQKELDEALEDVKNGKNMECASSMKELFAKLEN